MFDFLFKKKPVRITSEFKIGDIIYRKFFKKLNYFAGLYPSEIILPHHLLIEIDHHIRFTKVHRSLIRDNIVRSILDT
jgi:hypothetical protein